jgi:hypothetical protein
MPCVVWIAEDRTGYFAQCKAGRGRPGRAAGPTREVWSRRFEGAGEALSFVAVAAAVAQRLTWRREAARLAALVTRGA